LNPVSKPDQEYQMHQEPTQPGGKSTESNAIQVRDRSVAADGRHGPFVQVFESLRRLTLN
jgi:hypothetical protein